jgi:L-lactate dehydrogenase complex protein LldG
VAQAAVPGYDLWGYMNGRTTVARQRILERLRSSLQAQAKPFRDLADDLPVAPMTVYPVPEQVSLVESFGSQLAKLGGSFEMSDQATDVAERVAHKMVEWMPDETERTDALSWSLAELHVPGLEQALAELGVTLFVPSDLRDQRTKDHAASLAVGVTGVEAAFANTGSVALIPAPGRSSAAALLPLHHLVLIPLSRLHPTFETWLVKLRQEGQLSATLRDSGQIAFVTGPSKSADIELNLTLGVHGPKVVHAILFQDV